MNIEELNSKYSKLTPSERIGELSNDFKRILYTSSFGTTAVFLLHLFSKVVPNQEIYFLDTTYHFPETLAYKRLLTDKFNLRVNDLKGDLFRNKFTLTDRTWEKDPDLCCSVNKVEPLEALRNSRTKNEKFDVWVSGLMGSQNEHRKDLKIFELKNGTLKFYPIIDVTEEELNEWIRKNDLPEHPLKAKGYASVGCTHCTVAGKAREGRWINKSKTECGLHS